MSKSQIQNPKISNLKSPFFRSAAGFTILELLVVISIMAVIATLATGAAIKAVKNGRIRRIEATCRALEMALMNYRTQEGHWPFNISDLEQQFDEKDAYWSHGADNKKVFKKMYHGPGSANQTIYLDGSALMALADGQRVQLRTALGARKTDVPLLYPDQDNTSITRYFCVEYNIVTDKVTVHKQNDHTCPKWVKEKK